MYRTRANLYQHYIHLGSCLKKENKSYPPLWFVAVADDSYVPFLAKGGGLSQICTFCCVFHLRSFASLVNLHNFLICALCLKSLVMFNLYDILWSMLSNVRGGLLLPPISSNDSNFVPPDLAQPSLSYSNQRRNESFWSPKLSIPALPLTTLLGKKRVEN